jgi:CRP/FNR family transcriptional regulator, cyclic AMP receptor protein
MVDLLQLSSHLPEVDVESGHEILREGERTGAIWILVSGEVRVRRGTTVIDWIERPGAVIGEMAVLLDTAATASVEATEPSRLRHAANGQEFLADPTVIRLVAVGLADRLNLVTTYLVDLQDQYGDAPEMDMVREIFKRLMDRQTRAFPPGSGQDPGPDESG